MEVDPSANEAGGNSFFGGLLGGAGAGGEGGDSFMKDLRRNSFIDLKQAGIGG